MNTDDKKTIVIPAELEYYTLKERLEKLNNGYSQHPKFLTKAYEFAIFLYKKQNTWRFKDENEYISLSSKILKKKLGSNKRVPYSYYKNILSALEDIGILKIDNIYQSQHYCKQYKLKIEKPEDFVVETITPKYFPEINYQQENTNKHTIEQLQKIEIDQEQYILIANTLPYKKKIYSLDLYYNLTNKLHYLIKDKYQREHSLMTRVPKELRICLSVGEKHEKIYEVDFHAFQPLLILLLLKNSNKQFTDTQKQEFKQYFDTISKGQLYIQLYKKAENIKKDDIDKEKINKAKKQLFQHLFFGEISQKKINIVDAFKELYPNIFKEIQDYKLQYGYKEISHTLQKLESKIMDSVIKELEQTIPHEFFLRLHDAILTTKTKTEYIRTLLNSRIKAALGYDTMIKIQPFSLSLKEVFEKSNIIDKLNLKDLETKQRDGMELNKRIRDKMRYTQHDDKKIDKIKEQYYKNINAEERKDKKIKERNPEFLYPKNWDKTIIKQARSKYYSQIIGYFNDERKKIQENIRLQETKTGPKARTNLEKLETTIIDLHINLRLYKKILK